MNIKRFNPAPQGYMDEYRDGKWISYTDHIAALEANQQVIETLRAALDEYRAAMRYVYEHGFRHSSELPPNVFGAFNDAYAPVRATLTFPTQDEEAGNHAALSDNLNKEFPPEIVVAAERLLDQVLCNDSESCGGTDGLRTAATHDIASALMSERHRWFVAIDAHKDRIEELQAALEANQQVSK